MKCLYPFEEVLGEAKLGGRQLIEVTRIFGLLFGQHSSFAWTDAGAGELSPL